MKLHHTQYKKNYRAYILDHITDQDGNPLQTDQEKIDRLFDRFESEYGCNIDRLGYFKALQEWLQGLAIPFACYNHEIIDLAIKMGSIDEIRIENCISTLLQMDIFNLWQISFMALEKKGQCNDTRKTVLHKSTCKAK